MNEQEFKNLFEQGLEGEEIARKMLKNYSINIIKPDGIFKINNEYYTIEVKNKEHYQAPPFKGTGLNLYQVITRMDLFKQKNIRCILISRSPEDKIIYWQYLDILESGKKHLTKNKIIIYPLNSFNSVQTIEEVFKNDNN